jgi:hypothetical protein
MNATAPHNIWNSKQQDRRKTLSHLTKWRNSILRMSNVLMLERNETREQLSETLGRGPYRLRVSLILRVSRDGSSSDGPIVDSGIAHLITQLLSESVLNYQRILATKRFEMLRNNRDISFTITVTSSHHFTLKLFQTSLGSPKCVRYIFKFTAFIV